MGVCSSRLQAAAQGTLRQEVAHTVVPGGTRWAAMLRAGLTQLWAEVQEHIVRFVWTKSGPSPRMTRRLAGKSIGERNPSKIRIHRGLARMIGKAKQLACIRS